MTLFLQNKLEREAAILLCKTFGINYTAAGILIKNGPNVVFYDSYFNSEYPNRTDKFVYNFF